MSKIFKQTILILLLTMMQCNGNISIITSTPSKNASQYFLSELLVKKIFDSLNNGSSSSNNGHPYTQVTFKQRLVNKTEGTALETINLNINNNSRTVQKIANEQGDGNFNQNINIGGHLGDFNINSVGRRTIINYGNYKQEIPDNSAKDGQISITSGSSINLDNESAQSSHRTVQIVTDQQGDGNYNQNIHFNDNLGDFSLKSIGRVTNYRNYN